MNCVFTWVKTVGKFWEDILKYTDRVCTLFPIIICNHIFVRLLKEAQNLSFPIISLHIINVIIIWK